jgi:transcriptional regulator with XRE-family HTH domain
MDKGRGRRRRSPITQAVGRKLRALREARGISIAEVARRAETSTAAVRMVESGARAATLVTVKALADALSVPVKSLFSGPETAVPPDPEERVLLRLVRALRGRSRRQLQAIEKLVAAFDRAVEKGTD